MEKNNTYLVLEKTHMGVREKNMHIEITIHKETSSPWFKEDNLQSSSWISQFSYD